MNQQKLEPTKTAIDSAAIYQIRLNGKISSSLIKVVDDMQIRQEAEGDIVNLIGWLPDQTALIGLLNALNDIHQQIISVQILKIEK